MPLIMSFELNLDLVPIKTSAATPNPNLASNFGFAEI